MSDAPKTKIEWPLEFFSQNPFAVLVAQEDFPQLREALALHNGLIVCEVIENLGRGFHKILLPQGVTFEGLPPDVRSRNGGPDGRHFMIIHETHFEIVSKDVS